MVQYLTLNGRFGNPNSRTHYYGWQAEETIDVARRQIAELIGAHSNEIIFTSGATESVNLAIKGIAYAYCKYGKHIVTSITEHKSVLDSCQYLESQGFEITRIIPERNGLIELDQINRVLRKDTILLSIMHVNNEIGIIQDIEKIGQLCKYNNIIFHVDATQSVGKLYIDLSTLPVDLMSFSGHKLYGPKGVGALYIRDRNPKICIVPQIHGGGQEYGIRSGTLPVHQIVGMAEAFRIAKEVMVPEMVFLQRLRNRLWKGLQTIPGISVNGDLEYSIGTFLNVSFSYVDGATLISALKDFALSSGSACTSGTVNASYVLLSLGVDAKLASNSIRFSLGRFTTEEEIDYAIDNIFNIVARLKNIMYVL